jgi:hypothetical protein
METKQATKNGVTITYGIQDDHVVIFNPQTGQEAIKVSLGKPSGYQPPENEPGLQIESWDNFQSCMRGCYNPAQGDPWAFAGCIALCSTILFP